MSVDRYNRKQGQEKARGSKKGPKVLLSFEYLDIKQGQTQKDWADNKYLLKLNEMGARLNKLTVSQALADQLIIQYDTTNSKKWNKHNMPKGSKWNYPTTVNSPDIPWSKIELGRKLRVLGYLEANVFYVVFLDKDHKFYPSSA